MFHDTLEQKHVPQAKACGVLFVDWDGTIITIDKEKKLLDKEKIARIFRCALENDIDIHIITAMANEDKVYRLIFSYLRELGVLDNASHNEAFWRERIHCTTKDIAEMKKFKNDLKLNADETPKRKADLVRALVKKYYSHLEMDEKFFYDDNHHNWAKVKEYKDATSIYAHPVHHQFHLDQMDRAVQKMATAGYLKKTRVMRAALLRNINASLYALYPTKEARKKAETAFYEIHKLVSTPELCPLTIIKLHAIAKKQLGSLVSTWLPTLLGGGRDPMVQRFYSILEKLREQAENTLPALTHMTRVNNQLVGLLAAIQLQQNPVTAPQPPKSISVALG